MEQHVPMVKQSIKHTLGSGLLVLCCVEPPFLCCLSFAIQIDLFSFYFLIFPFQFFTSWVTFWAFGLATLHFGSRDGRDSCTKRREL